jgi:hypothetical protein
VGEGNPPEKHRCKTERTGVSCFQIMMLVNLRFMYCPIKTFPETLYVDIIAGKK